MCGVRCDVERGVWCGLGENHVEVAVFSHEEPFFDELQRVGCETPRIDRPWVGCGDHSEGERILEVKMVALLPFLHCNR